MDVKDRGFELIQKHNSHTDGSDSIFFLEAYFNKVSMIAEADQGKNPEQIADIIIKMEAICDKLKVVSHYITQVRTLQALLIFKSN